MSHFLAALLPEIGLMLLIAAGAVAFLQCLPLIKIQPPAFERALPWVQLWLVAVAFGVLIWLRVADDFTVENVFSHSNAALPLLYKIVGTWGNHEGSMVLIVLVLSGYHALFSRSASAQSAAGKTTCALMALIAFAFIAFIVTTSNPFSRVFPPPEDGSALNPLLQDIGLAMHPPMLYFGYIGFALVYSMSVAALAHGALSKQWALAMHGWLMFAWSMLTLGIALGSWWAYRELGWGGYWFWDPVENASLLPWLAATALIHANHALTKRGMLAHWVLLLAILTFSMSLLGTFLVRSGAVTSVHSFAADPTRGLFILAFFAAFTGGALLLYALRAGRIASEGVAAPLSRDGMMVLSSALFVLALFIVLLGTIYPMMSELFFDAPLSVGAPYFQITTAPVAAVMVLLAGTAPLMAWGNDRSRRIAHALKYPVLALLVAGFAAFAFSETNRATAAAGLALSAWLIIATILYARKSGAKKWPTTLAHMGAAVLLLGVTGMAAWRAEMERVIMPNEPVQLGHYEFTLENITPITTPNYTANIGTVRYARGSDLGTLAPQHRLYGIRNMATSEASIHPKWWGDVYAVMGETKGEGAVLRLTINPLIHAVWIGSVLMSAGGIAALFAARKRWKNPEPHSIITS